jgi:hypothetical protein
MVFYGIFGNFSPIHVTQNSIQTHTHHVVLFVHNNLSFPIGFLGIKTRNTQNYRGIGAECCALFRGKNWSFLLSPLFPVCLCIYELFKN